MQFNSIFVTGTDTGVGKTTVSCGIAAALRHSGRRVGVFKPAETGCSTAPDGGLHAEDAARLRYFSDSTASLETICPYVFPDPLAPLVAARRQGTAIDIGAIVRCHDAIAADHDVTLIEGAGGLLVPLTATATFVDLARTLNVPVLIVVGSRLGAINHAMLTMGYAQLIGLHVLGYIANFVTAAADEAARTNIDVLSELLGPPLGVVPYLGTIEMTALDRQRLAELFAERVKIAALLWPR